MCLSKHKNDSKKIFQKCISHSTSFPKTNCPKFLQNFLVTSTQQYPTADIGWNGYLHKTTMTVSYNHNAQTSMTCLRHLKLTLYKSLPTKTSIALYWHIQNYGTHAGKSVN